MKKIISILFVLPVLLSCSKENSDTPVPGNIAHLTSCMLYQNHSTVSESFSSPIGLYVLKEDNSPYGENYINSASFNKDKWGIASPVYITSPGKVYSYFPYVPGVNPERIPIDATKQIDWLYSRTPVSISPGNSSFSSNLYHAMSRIFVSVESETVREISLTAPVSALFNVCTGKFSEPISGTLSTVTGELLLIPHTSSSELRIILSSGKEYTYSLAASTFLSGESLSYNFRLNENREKLEVISFSIQNWTAEKSYSDYI